MVIYSFRILELTGIGLECVLRIMGWNWDFRVEGETKHFKKNVDGMCKCHTTKLLRIWRGVIYEMENRDTLL